MQPERGKKEPTVDNEKTREPLAPRVVILDKSGNFPLVEYKDTGWFGLPGGKVEPEDMAEGAEYLSAGAFPTLVREVQEECGIDTSGYISRSACLGVAEIGVVDSVNRRVDFNISPVFVCKADEIGKVNEKTRIANINSHISGPLFPDARMAIGRLREGIRHERGRIKPVWLNDKGVFYFEMRPQMRLLSGPPEWM